MKRHRLEKTLGVLLAGLFEAEKCRKARAKRRRRPRDGSGVFTVASLSAQRPF